MAFGKSLLVIAAPLLCSIGISISVQAQDTNPLARDLVIITDWFAGEFDNEEQRWFESDPRANLPKAEHHSRLHTVHTRIALDTFGQHVFYVEEYQDNDPDNVTRQRLVIFSSSADQQTIRMQQGFFKKPENFRHFNQHSRPDITTADVVFIPECDVFWSRTGSQFQGQMKPKSCVFGEGDDRRYAVHNLILSEDKYWRVDETYRVKDDTQYVGHPSSIPYKMNRAQRFICDAFFSTPDTPREEIKGLPLHNQGGTVDFTRSSDGSTFTLLMRTKEYPYYDTRPDFIYFSLRRKGEERSLAFVVADSLSRRVGLALPDMTFHCYREGYTFDESLDLLER